MAKKCYSNLGQFNGISSLLYLHIYIYTYLLKHLPTFFGGEIIKDIYFSSG